MFSNKELLQERINELDNAILNYKDDKINIFSFTTKERMLDCFINNNFCFASQGVYEKNDINFENIKSSACFIATDTLGEIKVITSEATKIFKNKDEAIEFLSISTEDISEISTPDPENINTESLVENIEYNEETLSNSIVSDVIDDLYTTIDYDKILAIDFETANEYHDKACSVGIALYENGEISLSKEFLINPETYFNKTNVDIHGITENMVKESPAFPVIWKNIFDIIDEKTLVIAHNAAFDIRLLQKLIAIYKCEYKEFDYLCTQNLYRSNIKLDAYNLKAVGIHIGETFEHHKAVDDSLVCLKAFLHVINEEKYFNRNLIENEFHTSIEKFTMTNETLAYTARVKRQASFNRFNTSGFKAKDLKPKTTTFDETHPVFGKVFTFTGDFTNFSSKEEAAQRIVDLGGIFKDGLVKANDYLVQGINLSTGLPMDGSKVQKVADYNNKGCNIQIITEFELMNLLSIKSTNEEEITPIVEETILENSTETNAIEENHEHINIDVEEVLEESNEHNIAIEIEQPIEEKVTIDKIESIENSIVTENSSKRNFKAKVKDTQLSMFDLMMGSSEEVAVEDSSTVPNQEIEPIVEQPTLGLDITVVKETKVNTTNPNEQKEVSLESTHVAKESKTYSLISPKGDYIKFETESEKLEKLKEYKLISAKATACDKSIYYKGVYSTEAIRCDIVGYLDLDVLVLNIDGKLHSIRGEYLKQMQDTNFSIFES
ncbi:MAG: exonuclease domain-containing protein [Sarcina sp.]